MDEVLVETRCEPVIIFRELLIPLMTSSGFELMFDSSDEKRYHTGFVWRRRYVDTDISSTTYGTTQTMELRVDVIGIPIGSSYLILHGILIGTQIDDATDIKLKIRCSLRNNSLTDIYAKSNPMFFRSSYTTLEEAELTTLSDYKEYLRVKIQTEFVCKLISMVSLRLDELPFEIKLKILSYLPLKSISSMSQVSTTWREIALDEQLWKLLVKKYFPDIYDRRVNGQSWKALFKDEFRRERLLLKRQHFAQSRDSSYILALPSSPPLLPIMGPAYFPMLPPPPAILRELMSFPH